MKPKKGVLKTAVQSLLLQQNNFPGCVNLPKAILRFHLPEVKYTGSS